MTITKLPVINGKPTHERANDAIADILDLLHSHMEGMSFATALGVLELAKQNLIEEAKQHYDTE